MRILRQLSLLAVAAVAGCAATPSDDAASTEGELRTLKPSEIVGFLQYGNEATVAYTDSPTYRGYKFRANAYDRITVTVDADTPDTEAVLTIVDETGWERPGTQKVGKHISATYTQFGAFDDHTIVVREKSMKPSSIRVKLESTGVSTPGAAFVPETGPYAVPANLIGKDTDVLMRCLRRTFSATGGPATEAEETGLISLRFGASLPTVIGADAAARSLTYATLTSEAPRTYANALALGGRTSSDSHRLQITNTGPGSVRVEYAHRAQNSFATEAELSCSGVGGL